MGHRLFVNLIAGMVCTLVANATEPLHRMFIEPIHPKIWAMRDDAALVAGGAVVLEDRWRLGLQGFFLEHILRVRVLNSAGQAAAKIAKITGKLLEIEGRIAYPDGTFLILDKVSDLHEKTGLNYKQSINDYVSRTYHMNRTILDVPGITSDCVFELKLKIRPETINWMEVVTLQNTFPTQAQSVEINNGFDFKVLFCAIAELKPSIQKKGNIITTTFLNLPPIQSAPFSANFTKSVNMLFIYPPQIGVESQQNESPGAFWGNVATEIWKRELEFDPFFRIKGGYKQGQFIPGSTPKERKHYDNLLASISKDLPASPQAKARELHARLSSRIKQWPYWSKEFAEWHKKLDSPRDALDASDIECIIKNGATFEKAWGTLYYNLLRDNGLHPSLVMAVSAHTRPFLVNLRSTLQFERTFLRIEEEGKPPLYLDTTQEEGNLGTIPPWFQGTEAMIIETANWTPATLRLPWQSPSNESTEMAYTIEQDGPRFRFQTRASFYGVAQSKAREDFIHESDTSRSDHLAKSLENACLYLAVDEASVSDPEDKKTPFTWSAKGHLAISGEDTVFIPPFPAHSEFFPLPHFFPSERHESLYLGPPRKMKWTSRIAIPKGFRWVSEPPTESTFDFALIRRGAHLSENGTHLEITTEVTTTRGLLPASSYKDFRKFLTHLQCATNDPLVLERIL